VLAVTAAYRNGGHNTKYQKAVSIFAQVLELDAAKTVATLTLPNTPAVASHVAATHVWAMTWVPQLRVGLVGGSGA
jgi:hypothetical protein